MTKKERKKHDLEGAVLKSSILNIGLCDQIAFR